MAEKKLVASLSLDAEQAKQELSAITAAEQALRDQGIVMATDVAAGFTQIEDRVGKAFDKLSSGSTVSQNELNRLASTLGALREAVEAAGVPLEEMPAEFQKAFATANSQLASLTQAMGSAASRTAEVRKEIDELAQSADKVDELRAAGVRVDEAFEKFTQTLRDNPKEALEQFPRLAGTVIQFRQEIQKTQAAGGVVDPQDLARLRQFEQALDDAKNEARTMKGEIDKLTAGVNDASQAWQGFGSYIKDAAGSMGQFGIAAIGATAALNEGLAAGQNFNRFVGTDMSEWDKLLQGIGLRLRLIIESASNGIVSLGGVITATVKAVTTGDATELKTALADLAETGKTHAKNLGDAFSLSRKELMALHPELVKNTEETKNAAKATEDLASAHKKAAAEVEAYLAAGDREYEARQKQTEATRQATQAQIDGALALGQSTEATEAQVISIGNHKEAIEAELAIVRELLDARGVQREQMTAFNTVQMDAGVSTDYLLQKEAALVRQAEESISVWHAEKDVKKEKNDAQKILADMIEEEKKRTNELAGATKALKVVYDETTNTIRNVADETERAGIKVVKFEDDTTKAAAKVAENLAAMRSSYETEFAAMEARMDAAASKMDALITKTNELRAATASAAGEGEA